VNPKSLARILVLTVALAGALAVLSGKIPLVAAALFVILVNGGVVGWLKWHEEQHTPTHH
jgi:hypothetical protein